MLASKPEFVRVECFLVSLNYHAHLLRNGIVCYLNLCLFYYFVCRSVSIQSDCWWHGIHTFAHLFMPGLNLQQPVHQPAWFWELEGNQRTQSKFRWFSQVELRPYPTGSLGFGTMVRFLVHITAFTLPIFHALFWTKLPVWKPPQTRTVTWAQDWVGTLELWHIKVTCHATMPPNTTWS